jgi:hypothetical protein
MVLKATSSSTTAYKPNVRPEHLKLSASECYAQSLFTETKIFGYECFLFSNGQAAIYFASGDSLRVYGSQWELIDAIPKINTGSLPKAIEEFRAWRSI